MKDKIKLIISLLKLVRPFLMIMLLAIILGVLGHLTATFITVFIILAFCKVISFSLAVKLIILCAFSRGILRYIEQACNHYIAFKVLAHIRHLVFEKLRELAPAKLENEDKGNIIAMLTSDVELLEVFFAHTISPVMIAFIYSIIMICFIGSYHFVFGILAFVCYGIMGILIPYITYKVSQKEGSNYRFLLANFNTFVLETVLGKREILQFSQQEKRFEQMMDHQNNLTQTHQKLIKHQSFQQILSDGLIILSIVISILLIKNHVSKELLIPMMALSSSFGPTIALANLANNLNQVFPCARRILNLLDEEPLLKEITNKNTILNLPIEIKNQQIIIEGNESASFVGDYKWQQEAVTNIIKNCIEHNKQNGKIYIKYEENTLFTKITIRDEGEGMTKEDLKHIFERFYKGQNSSENSVGIGLALAKNIIEKNNGMISCKSELDKGTEFVIKYMK